jgi:hypothetical protein
MDFRISYGEKITGDSWVMRDWQTTNQNYGARWGLATNPTRLQSSAIKRLLSRGNKGYVKSFQLVSNVMNGRVLMDIVKHSNQERTRSCVLLTSKF